MGEIKTPVKVYHVEYICDSCGMDFMKFTGQMHSSYPPWFRHVCPKCGESTALRYKYPRIVYEQTGGDCDDE